LAITKGGNMKNMKRALRRHQKNVKYIARIKRWASGIDVLYIDKDNRIYNPTWIEIREFDGICKKLKTMSTVCSCSMCAYLKYDRPQQKRINKMFLNLELEK